MALLAILLDPSLALADRTMYKIPVKPKIGDLQPLNSQVQVAVVIPKDLAGLDPSWFNNEGNPNGFLGKNRVIGVQMSEPIAEFVSKIIMGYFPQAIFVDDFPDKGNFDLVIQLEIDLSFAYDTKSLQVPQDPGRFVTNTELESLSGTVSLQIHESKGKKVGEVAFNYQALPRRGNYWSDESQSKAYGKKFLEQLFLEFPSLVRKSPALVAFLGERSKQWAAPCLLSLNARLDESESLMPNGVLDAGEQTSLIIGVKNEGPGPAFGVTLELDGEIGVSLETPRIFVGRLEPGESKAFKAGVSGSLALTGSDTRIRVSAREERSFDAVPVVLRIATAALEAPMLEILEFAITGSDDQRLDLKTLENGTDYILRGVLRNRGEGHARGVYVDIGTVSGQAEFSSNLLEVGLIKSGQAVPIQVALRIPRVSSDDELVISLVATEGRGSSVASASRKRKWNIRKNSPTFHLSWVLFDGQKASTRGNRDGRLSNGESALLELTVANKGELEAQDVVIKVTSLVSGIQFQENELRIGNLPPSTTSQLLAIPLTASRLTSLPEGEDDAQVYVSISHRGFGSSEEVLRIPFEDHRPDLHLAGRRDLQILQGSRVPTSFTIENRGNLAAEDVRVKIRTEGSGIDLLDSQGKILRFPEFNLGPLDPNSDRRSIDLVVLARTGAAVGEQDLILEILQGDFPPMERRVPVKLIAAKATEVALGERLPQPDENPAQSSLIASFRNLDEGQVLWNPNLAVELDVFTPRRLSTVVVTQNGRRIEIGRESRSKRPGGDGYRIRFPLVLEHGANEIVATVVTDEGGSIDTRVHVDFSPEETLADSRTYRFEVTEHELDRVLAGASIRINGAEAELTRNGRSVELRTLGSGEPVRDGLNRVVSYVDGKKREMRMFLENLSLKAFEEPYKKSYAILMAIDDYDRKRDRQSRGPTGYRALRGMRSRAEELKAALGQVGFPAENVLTLYDQDATARALEDLLEQFWPGGKYAGADRLFVYYGGHGDDFKGRGFLVTYDFNPSRPTASGFVMSRIMSEQFENLDVHHVLFALDSCSSGLAVPGSKTLGGDESAEELRKFRSLSVIRADTENQARNLLVAGTGNEAALYENGGIFTEALIRGLKGEGDQNRDGIIQLTELENFVRGEVVSRANETNVSQKPVLVSADRLGDGRLVFLLDR